MPSWDRTDSSSHAPIDGDGDDTASVARGPIINRRRFVELATAAVAGFTLTGLSSPAKAQAAGNGARDRQNDQVACPINPHWTEPDETIEPDELVELALRYR